MNLRVRPRVKCLLSSSTNSVEVKSTSNSYFPWWRLTSHSHHLFFFFIGEEPIVNFRNQRNVQISYLSASDNRLICKLRAQLFPRAMSNIT